MIDVRYLADPGRCPACAAELAGRRDACPACRLPLTGPAAVRLWEVSVQASRLLAERARLVETLRAEGWARATQPAAQHTTQSATPAPGQAAPQWQPVTGQAAPGVPRAPRAEWTPRRVQNLLLGLGVALLAVAALIFVVVSWGSLGVGGRAAVMTGVTALAAAGAYAAFRRGLSATAEALSLLTVGLALLDCLGAWASDLAGLRDVDGAYVAAGATALVATLAGAGSVVLRTRALRLSAALLGQLPVLLVGGHAADASANPLALLGTAATAQAVAAAAVTLGWRGRPDTGDARVTVAVGTALAGALGVLLATGAAYAEPGSLVVGTALLLVLAAAVAVGSELVPAEPVAAPLRGLTAALVTTAAWAPVVDATADRWTAPALAVTAGLLLALAVLVPADRRAVPAGTLLAAVALTGVAAAPVVVAAVVGRLQWLDDAWTADPGPAADLLLVGEVAELPRGAVAPAALVLLVVAAAAALARFVHGSLRLVAPGSVPVAAAAGLLAVVAVEGPYAGGLAVDLVLALAGLAGGVWLHRRGHVAWAVGAAASGAVVLGLGVAWGFAVDTATLVVLPLAAAVLAVAVALGRGLPALRAQRVAGSAAAALLLVTEAAAVARDGGAGWPAVTALVLSLLAVLGAATAALVVRRAPGDAFWAGVRSAGAGVAAVAVIADAGALAWWQGVAAAGTGLAVAVTASVLLAGTAAPLPERVVDAEELRAIAVVGGVVGTVTAALDGDRLWLALLATGVAVSVLAVRVDHRLGWVAGGLLTASSWVRLALSEVEAPEAYTVPPAIALLLVGWRKRVADPTYRSWSAYGPGLALALGPSLLRAVTDAGNLRPFLLGVAALAVLAVGVARRLQAPLLIGGGVLVVDALVQLAPYLVALYDVVPRWVTIGTVGLLLLGAGATYEQRVRDVRRVGRQVARLS